MRTRFGSSNSAKSSYDAFLNEVMGDWVHPPLFFFLMYALDAIFGIDDLSGKNGCRRIRSDLRSGDFLDRQRLVHSERAGIVAAVVLALSPIHIWHSQYGRHYSLLVLLVLLSTATFLESVAGTQESGYGQSCTLLSTVALVYTHYFGWIVVMCQSATFLDVSLHHAEALVRSSNCPYPILRSLVDCCNTCRFGRTLPRKS